MYDELVKRLREDAEDGYLIQTRIGDDIAEAADAIEELSKRVDESIPKDDAEIIIAEVAKPRWIPVTERLPEQRINQNTLDFEYVLCATTFGDVRPYKYGRKIGQREAHFWNGAGYVDAYVTHWMPLPEPQKEG